MFVDVNIQRCKQPKRYTWNNHCRPVTAQLQLINIIITIIIDISTFSFFNHFKSAQHVSGDTFAHPQEHFFDCIYSFWYNAPTLLPTGATVEMEHQFHLNRGAGQQQCRFIVPKAVYMVKNCSWGWANLSPETCRADLKRLINEKVSASCWLFTSLSTYKLLTLTKRVVFG